VGASDLVASAGVTLILIAFVLNLAGRLERIHPTYLWLNLAGAGLACFAAIMVSFFPFIVLEAVWAVAALIGLVRLKLASSAS
jgi:hypothetical protein